MTLLLPILQTAHAWAPTRVETQVMTFQSLSLRRPPAPPVPSAPAPPLPPPVPSSAPPVHSPTCSFRIGTCRDNIAPGAPLHGMLPHGNTTVN
jgi:hypothetical protein